MSVRKIIQIAALNETEDSYGALYALCNDGSLWSIQLDGGETTWQPFDAIPQHELPVSELARELPAVE